VNKKRLVPVATAIFDFLASLKLAVIVILGLVVSLSTATILEAIYDTPTAQYWVYRSAAFHGLLALLGVNIFVVMLSRYPWKPRHLPFLMAHIGILILLAGSWITDRVGLDASMRISEGETASVVDLDNASLVVTEGSGHHQIPVKWVPPGVTFKPIDFRSQGVPYDVRVDRFLSHADPIISFVPAAAEDKSAAPAVQLIVKGGAMRITQEYWLWAGDKGWSSIQAGPARLIFGEVPQGFRPDQTWLAVAPGKDGSLSYTAHSASGETVKGKVSAQGSSVIDPHWKGGVTITVAKWIPKAVPFTRYEPARIEYGQSAPPPALHLIAGTGSETADIWMGLGDRAVFHLDGREVTIGYFPRRIVLPFSVQLERFTIERYAGSNDPASYSSQVRVSGRDSDKVATISMNEPLEHSGYTLYQASYEDGQPRPTVSIFSVNRDPGRVWKYLGSLLIVLGSIALSAMKYVKRRSSMSKNTHKEPAAVVALLLAVSLGGLLGLPATARAGGPDDKHPAWSFKDAGLIPVQSGGRIKPMDSFARELVLFTTGSRSFQGWDPVDLMFSWIAAPHAWQERPFIRINREDVKRQLGLNEKQTFFAPKELYKNEALGQYAQRMGDAKAGMPAGTVGKDMGKPSARDQELRRVVDRLGLFHNIVSGDAWLVVPKPNAAPWASLATQEKDGQVIRAGFVELLKAYQSDDAAVFRKAAILTKAAVQAEVQNWSPSMARTLDVEVLYNRARPFLWTWILYLTGAVLWAFALYSPKNKRLAMAGMLVSSLGVLLHIAGMTMRSYVAGRPPVTNMYESVVWVSFGVMIFAGILYFISQRPPVVMLAACTLATLGLVLGDSAPAILDPSLNPLVPVLRSNYWLTIHVLTITLGYAAFALTLGLADFSLFQFLRSSLKGGKKGSKGTTETVQKIASLNQLTYRATQFGVVLLAAGTILGGVWADYSWGRFWGWDPKEVWALIALLCYLAILHGRYSGWVGQFGFAAWSVVSFLSVLMAWYGVNFVLGVGLHSYGFSSGGFGFVGSFVGLHLIYVALVAIVYYRPKLLKRQPA